MRFVCETRQRETLIEAETPEDAARLVAEAQAGLDGLSDASPLAARTYTVTVSEANDSDMPLIVGDDHTVVVDPAVLSR